MKLYAQHFDGPGSTPLVILHGMLGSSRNWTTVGKRLADFCSPHALDLPNHGRSPWSEEASIDMMAHSVLEWMDANDLQHTALMGHSLGGKVGMRIACDASERITQLFVLDIAPRAYAPDTSTLDAMMGIDVTALETRTQADEQLALTGMGPSLRGFLLTNLVRSDAGGFAWQVPLATIRNLIPEWTRAPLTPDDVYEGSTLFIAGGRGTYLTATDYEAAQVAFPNSAFLLLPESGHNVHVEGGDAFVDAVRTAMETG